MIWKNGHTYTVSGRQWLPLELQVRILKTFHDLS